MTAIRNLGAWLVVATFGITAAGGDTKSDQGKPVAYATGYTAYFVKNNAPVKDNPAYLILSGKEAFERVFGFGRTMKKVKVIDPKEFETKIAVVVIRKGNAIWTYQIQDVTATDGTLRVAYQATVGNAGSATFASPLIVLVDGKANARVVFVENGKEVAKVPVKKAE
jgi:hypothetical protein